MKQKKHFFSLLVTLSVLTIFHGKLHAFEVVEITESYIKGITIPFSQGEEYEIALTLQKPENERTTISAVWNVPKGVTSVKFPVFSGFVLLQGEIQEIARIYGETYNCSSETLSSLISDLSQTLNVKFGGGLCYNQSIRNVFIREPVIECFHSKIENIVLNTIPVINQNNYSSITRYRVPPFLGIDQAKITIYVPHGGKEVLSKIAWFRNVKAIVECDPEEKWQEFLNED